MLKQRLKGFWQQLKGGAKRSYGEATGDRKAKVEGTVEQNIGRAREGVARKVDEVKRDVRYGEPSDPHAHI